MSLLADLEAVLAGRSLDEAAAPVSLPSMIGRDAADDELARRLNRELVPAAAPVEPEPVARRPRGDALIADLNADPERGPDGRPYWPASFLSDGDSGQTRACRNMWSDSVRMRLADVLTERSRATGEAALRPLRWVGTSEFHASCANAGLDGEAVAAAVQAVASDPALLAAMLKRLGGQSETVHGGKSA